MKNETHVTENLRVVSLKQLITPTRLKEELPLGNELTEKVLADRQTVRDIIHLKDPRLLVVIGPCSIMIRSRHSTMPGAFRPWRNR